jgi:hypothetical protein
MADSPMVISTAAGERNGAVAGNDMPAVGIGLAL